MKRILKYILNKIKYQNSTISYFANLSSDSNLGIGVKILANSRLSSCRVGNFTYVGLNSIFERTVIGSFTSIGPDVLCGLASHPLSYLSTYPGFYSKHASGAIWFGSENPDFTDKKSVSVGSDVWIGARSIILGGVSIGHGAVVGAGSIVTKDVPPYAIIAGVPAKIIKYRFDELMIKRLLESNWWNLPVHRLQELAPLTANPDAFLNKLSDHKDREQTNTIESN